MVDYFAAASRTLALLRLEPLFPILGARYTQVHAEGRKAILGRVQPGPLPIKWPAVVHMAAWFGRGAEELAAGLARAAGVWRLARPARRQLLLLLLPLLLVWLLRRRLGGRGRRPRTLLGAAADRGR